MNRDPSLTPGAEPDPYNDLRSKADAVFAAMPYEPDAHGLPARSKRWISPDALAFVDVKQLLIAGEDSPVTFLDLVEFVEKNLDGTSLFRHRKYQLFSDSLETEVAVAIYDQDGNLIETETPAKSFARLRRKHYVVIREVIEKVAPDELTAWDALNARRREIHEQQNAIINNLEDGFDMTEDDLPPPYLALQNELAAILEAERSYTERYCDGHPDYEALMEERQAFDALHDPDRQATTSDAKAMDAYLELLKES